MKHLFGPVRSRRLGRSLGIDLLPDKICPFDCLYCEVGPTVRRTCQRCEYTSTAGILQEIDDFIAQEGAAGVDVYTVTAQGEPTLHTGLGRVLRHLRQRGGRPVVVLTNGALLHDAAVRQELAAADIVVPSLDAARYEAFLRLNRPEPGFDLDGMIEGLLALCAEHPGAVWLEILLAAGCNDSEEDLAALAVVLCRLPPSARHRVQLNTVTRPSRTAVVHPLTLERLQAIASQLQKHCPLPVEVLATAPVAVNTKDCNAAVADPALPSHSPWENQAERIVQMVRRRPCTAEELWAALGLAGQEAPSRALLERLVVAGRLRRQCQGAAEFYLPGTGVS
ncbi:MAG: hypothetical protein BWK76_25375 [Desulfobulbaceae bacterium A2]|nr:MAG: hypothetical protein BWK76_25375 [Desulfobulbaceae bacterium A2]